MGFAADGFLGFGKNSAQDIHFQLADTAATVEPAQARHEMTRLLRIEKTDLNQGLLEMSVVMLEFVCGDWLHIEHRGGFEFLLLAWLIVRSQPCHTYLIGNHLHGSGKVQ